MTLRPRVPPSAALVLVVAILGCRESVGGSPGAHERRPSGGTETALPPPVVVGAEACRGSGYLCAGLAERDEPRILRWSSGTPEIRVRVSPPPVDDRALSRALQDAAVRGILAWQGTPFRIRVDRLAEGGDADIVLEWTQALSGNELGRAETEWTRGGDGSMEMRVRRFVLALENPVAPGRLLTPEEVQLTAAHEMGHALGLPHSDSPRDVMYATNTATALSPRDYETMAGLYRLENGALLQPAAPEGS